MSGRKPAWKRNAVTNELVDLGDGTLVRKVNLVSLKSAGISDADRDAIFDFERPILGTLKATLRIQFRSQGNMRKDKATGEMVPMVMIPRKLAEAGPIPAELAGFYK